MALNDTLYKEVDSLGNPRTSKSSGFKREIRQRDLRIVLVSKAGPNLGRTCTTPIRSFGMEAKPGRDRRSY